MNDYDLSGEYGVGYTIKGEPFYFDLDDYDKIKNIDWRTDINGYIINQQNHETKLMHRIVIECPDGLHVDHKHGKESRNDNRKENLRAVTVSQNMMNRPLQKNNTSGITGVCWDKKSKKWRAYIKINKKRIELGFFVNFEDAVEIRKEAEEKYFGEYKYSNNQED